MRVKAKKFLFFGQRTVVTLYFLRNDGLVLLQEQTERIGRGGVSQ